MSESISEAIIQIRVPNRLLTALEAEAQKRMLNRSQLARMLLAHSLGLLDGNLFDYATNGSGFPTKED